MLQYFRCLVLVTRTPIFFERESNMETKKTFGTNVIAGALLALVALLRLVNFFQFVRYHFNFPALVGVAVFAFVAAMLLTNRRDNLLLIALGVLAVNQLIWSSVVDFVAAALLLVVALVMTTEYLPQAKALAEKIWFVPAILSVIGGLVGIFGGMRYGYITFLSVVWFLVEAAAMLLCGFWLAFPERDISELFAAAKAKAGAVAAAAAAADNSVAEAEVDGYCDLFKQVLLMMLTFGIWYYIWIFRMTRYLNRVGGMEKRTPVNQLLLCLFVPFYVVYWTYQSALRTDKLAAAVGVESDRSTLCLILAAMVPLAAPLLIQDKINEVIGVESGSRAADFDPAAKPAVRLTAAPETVKGFCGLFKHLLLMMLTCGVWFFIWIYRVTDYLNRVEGQPQRKPVNKLLLCMFVPFYLYYWIYKSAGLIDKLGEQTGVRSKLAAPCLILSLVAGFVPVILMQAKINEIITFENTEVVAPVEAVAEEVAKEKEEN